MRNRNYTPRRASKRWLEAAPEYVLDCFDNRGKTCDRYTVLLGGEFIYHLKNGVTYGEGPGEYSETYISSLDMSDAPEHPQGVSMWGDLRAFDAVQFRYHNKHYRVRWLDLPKAIRRHIKARAESD